MGIVTLLVSAMQVSIASSRPHIIFTMVDDLGYNGFGFGGHNSEVISPTIDKLAAEGVILTNHYTYKFCSPTRASFLTGRLPGHGIQNTNLGMTAASGCNIKLTMIGAKLQQAGYSTHQVGKWHQGFFLPAYTPHGRGFNTSFGFLGGGEDHLSQCHACENEIPSPDYATEKFNCPASYSPCGEVCPTEGGVDLYCTDKPCFGANTTANPYLYAREMTRIVRSAASSPSPAAAAPAAAPAPLFVFLAVHNVHQPVESPEEFVDLYPASDYNSSNYARRVYNGMHYGVEYVVKNVTEEMQAAGLWDNTIFVLCGDNGGTFEHGMPVPGSSNYPLRGHKYSWFEGGVRVASFVASPLLPASVRGTRSDVLLHIADWYATFAVLAGLAPSDNCEGCVPLDGLDAWPAITRASRAGPRSELLLGAGSAAAYINGSYKWIQAGGNAVAADGYSAQYPGTTHALPVPPSGSCTSKPCLFNLAKDPRETTDLIDVLPDIAAAMEARYDVLFKNLTAPNGDLDFDTAFRSANGEPALECDHDLCWETGMLYIDQQRKKKMLTDGSLVHFYTTNDDTKEISVGERSVATRSQTQSPCLLDGDWYIGTQGEDVMHFQTGENNSVTMSIASGCQMCAFTGAVGTMDGDGVKVNIVASGKGVWVDHLGEISAQGSEEGCVIQWLSHNTTSHGWANFCKGKRCGSPHPPSPPPGQACKAMLSAGYWVPWVGE